MRSTPGIDSTGMRFPRPSVTNMGQIRSAGVSTFSATSLRDHPALRRCVVNRLFAFSKGRRLTRAELDLGQRYQSDLDTTGYRFDAMLRLIILDPTFFAVQPSSAPAQTASRSEPNASQN